jgi:Sigma-70 region 2
MAKAQQASALRHVELLFNAGTTIGLSDRQLLERFLDQGDGPRNLAFAALIERHGPMVRRVCRSILRSEHAADDAFQATLISGTLVAVMVALAGVGVWARQETKVTAVRAPEQVTRIEESIPVNEIDRPATEELSNDSDAVDIPSSLKYGDGHADGKKSIGGSGELIEFTGAAAAVKVAGVRIHGSRYGQAQAPQESFLIYFLNNDMSRILHTEMAPYSLMERGTEEWVEISFERPVDLPKTFWVALDFRATQTKGVYLSFDTSTGGKHSRVGLPGARTSKVTFGGDWMIEATLAK